MKKVKSILLERLRVLLFYLLTTRAAWAAFLVVDGILLRFTHSPKSKDWGERDLPSATLWGLLLPVATGLVATMAVVSCGCSTGVQVTGGQTHEVNVHHDDQNTHIWIHKDRRRHPNPQPAPKK